MVWSEGGKGSRAHSPELVVARVLVIAQVLVVTRVLTVTRVLVVARVHSRALAIIREMRWLSWLVVGRVRRGQWAVDGGGRSFMGSGRSSWLVVVVSWSWWWAVVALCCGHCGRLATSLTATWRLLLM